jgi:hypothetical protein
MTIVVDVAVRKGRHTRSAVWWQVKVSGGGGGGRAPVPEKVPDPTFKVTDAAAWVRQRNRRTSRGWTKDGLYSTAPTREEKIASSGCRYPISRAVVVLYRGQHRLKRRGSWQLLDRACRNPAIADTVAGDCRMLCNLLCFRPPSTTIQKWRKHSWMCVPGVASSLVVREASCLLVVRWPARPSDSEIEYFLPLYSLYPDLESQLFCADICLVPYSTIRSHARLKHLRPGVSLPRPSGFFKTSC